MKKALTGFLLSLAAFAPTTAAPTAISPSQPPENYNCGTLSDIIERSKPVLTGPSSKFRESAQFRVWYKGQEKLITSWSFFGCGAIPLT